MLNYGRHPDHLDAHASMNASRNPEAMIIELLPCEILCITAFRPRHALGRCRARPSHCCAAVATLHAAAVKLNGVLLDLEVNDEPQNGAARFSTRGTRIRPTPRRPGRLAGKAELVFELDPGLTVGYRGFYDCETGWALPPTGCCITTMSNVTAPPASIQSTVTPRYSEPKRA